MAICAIIAETKLIVNPAYKIFLVHQGTKGRTKAKAPNLLLTASTLLN